LTAGPLPARLDGEVKERLLKLVDDAVAAGWAHTRACSVLGVTDVRVHRWRARLRQHGTVVDRAPGGNPVHRLLAWEEAAILALIEDWGTIDRSHRKLAHRGSYTGIVFVSPSTVLRVAEKHLVSLPGDPPRPLRPAPVLPAVPWERNRIWIWDASHFTRAKRTAYAIIDVVTRYWIGYLLTSETTSTQVQLLFAGALEDQGLLDPVTGVLLGADGQPLHRSDDTSPILVAWSDNGPEMTSGDTREFMALMTIAQHHGRPGTPTDQAHVESFFSHLKGDWPHLEQIRDPAVLDTELARVRRDYNMVRLHAGIGYVTPDDEHHGRGPAIRRARAAGLKQARHDRITHNRKHRPGSTR
jgi:putative transposase